MDEIMFSIVMEFLFPALWFVASILLFGCTVYKHIKKKCVDWGLADPDEDEKICAIACMAAVFSIFFATVDFTGICKNIASNLTSDSFLNSLISYALRWLFASIIDSIICAVGRLIYLQNYIKNAPYL